MRSIYINYRCYYYCFKSRTEIKFFIFATKNNQVPIPTNGQKKKKKNNKQLYSLINSLKEPKFFFTIVKNIFHSASKYVSIGYVETLYEHIFNKYEENGAYIQDSSKENKRLYVC